MTEGEVLRRFIAAMPKVELHVHLEGALQPETLLALARRRRVTLPADSVEGLHRWFRFRDFDHFVEVYLLCSECLRDPEDFQLLVNDFLAEQERQHVLHTEAHFTVSTHLANGANGGEIADAMRESLAENERRRGVRMRLIPDIVRNAPFARADQTLEWALDHRDGLVAALGLSGAEDSAIEPFREHFAEAARLGLHRTVHAGEQAGPEVVWQALELCGAERIGHGIRAVDDPRLVATLRARQIPLEVCPTSNVKLGFVASLSQHPLKRLVEEGVVVSINSDDPALFDTSLNEEYEAAAEMLDLDAAGVERLVQRAVSAAFMADAERRQLAEDVEERLRRAWLELGA